ncbi:MAG: ECF transporter S component [Desulfurococcales archaeon]|nr:ECF transporter S component [Desulfurococcales archaeon]
MKFDIIKAALYTAVVYVATVVVQVSTPATGGYFNLGETAIYVAAVLTNPLTAAVAGGVGSALADLTTGYSYYSPGTLIIKFIEGFTVAYLISRLKGWSLARSKVASVITGIAVGAVIAFIGYTQLSGKATVSSAPIQVLGLKISSVGFNTYLPGAFWLTIGAIVAALLIYAALAKGGRNIHIALSIIIGGSLMVLGYFLYEYFFVNPVVLKSPPIQAATEIPVNYGQVFVGLAVASPIAAFVREAVGSEAKDTGS